MDPIALLKPEMMLGPTAGLAISLYFSFPFLKKFEATTDKLVEAFKIELAECNTRYEFVLTELLKLKESK